MPIQGVRALSTASGRVGTLSGRPVGGGARHRAACDADGILGRRARPCDACCTRGLSWRHCSNGSTRRSRRQGEAAACAMARAASRGSRRRIAPSGDDEARVARGARTAASCVRGAGARARDRDRGRGCRGEGPCRDRIDELATGGLAIVDYKSGRVAGPARRFGPPARGHPARRLRTRRRAQRNGATARAPAFAKLKAGEIEVRGIADRAETWPGLDVAGTSPRVPARRLDRKAIRN